MGLKCVGLVHRGDLIIATVENSQGQRFTAHVNAADLAGDPELGSWFSRKFKKFKHSIAGKVLIGPVLLAHRITHTGPIEKLHKAIQRRVGKTLPFLKPFISIHNSLASPVHKLIEGKKVEKKATAIAILDATKHLPAGKNRTAVRMALAMRANEAIHLRDLARVGAIKKAAAKAKSASRSWAPKKGVFQVLRPDGRLVNVAASRVVH